MTLFAKFLSHLYDNGNEWEMYKQFNTSLNNLILRACAISRHLAELTDVDIVRVDSRKCTERPAVPLHGCPL